MKLLYVAALLVPTILAADVGARDTQLTDAQPVQGAGGLADVQKILKEECPDLPPRCFQGGLERLLRGGTGRNNECGPKVFACLKKVAPKIAAAKGSTQPR